MHNLAKRQKYYIIKVILSYDQVIDFNIKTVKLNVLINQSYKMNRLNFLAV